MKRSKIEKVLILAFFTSFLLTNAACSSKKVRDDLVTLPANDEHGRSLSYVSDSMPYGPRGCGMAINPNGGKIWIYSLDCFFHCAEAQEKLGIDSPTLCQQICK
jgi:hypothetical protein